MSLRGEVDAVALRERVSEGVVDREMVIVGVTVEDKLFALREAEIVGETVCDVTL